MSPSLRPPCGQTPRPSKSLFLKAETVGHNHRELDAVRLGRDELVHGVHQLSHLLGERRLLLVKLGEALSVRLVHRL